MGRTYETHASYKMHARFLWETPKWRDHLEDLQMDGRVLLKCTGLFEMTVWVLTTCHTQYT